MTEYLETKLVCIPCAVEARRDLGEDPPVTELPGSSEYLAKMTGLHPDQARKLGESVIRRILYEGSRPF